MCVCMHIGYEGANGTPSMPPCLCHKVCIKDNFVALVLFSAFMSSLTTSLYAFTTKPPC